MEREIELEEQKLLNVYVLEKNVNLLHILEKELSEYSFIKGIKTSRSYSKILLMCQNEIPDVIILDVDTNDIPWEPYVIFIKKHYTDISLIAMSTNSESSFREKIIENGFNGFVFKESGSEGLIRVMKSVCYPQLLLTINPSLI